MKYKVFVQGNLKGSIFIGRVVYTIISEDGKMQQTSFPYNPKNAEDVQIIDAATKSIRKLYEVFGGDVKAFVESEIQTAAKENRAA